MKTCKRCKDEKSELAFSRNKNTADSYEDWCKACKSTYNKERISKRTELLSKRIYVGSTAKTCRTCLIEKTHDDFSSNVNYSDGLHIHCRKCYNKTSVEFYATNPNTSSYSRKKIVEAKGMTVEQYNTQYVTQNGQCLGCKGHYDVLSIDHDHRCCPGTESCGKCVRGLICMRCNSALGMVKDNPDTLAALIGYLENNLANGRAQDTAQR